MDVQVKSMGKVRAAPVLGSKRDRPQPRFRWSGPVPAVSMRAPEGIRTPNLLIRSYTGRVKTPTRSTTQQASDLHKRESRRHLW